jgi:hypothetical protein
MRTYGSLEDILTMIESGEQGKHLQERVQVIRDDVHWMQVLRKLWEDPELDQLMNQYLI